MTIVFHSSQHGRFIEIKTTSGGKHFIERIKTPVLLETILIT